MSKARLWTIALLTLVVLALIGWNFKSKDTDKELVKPNDTTPTYQSQDTLSVVYDPAGKLNYKLIAKNVQHNADDKVSWFTEPVLTTFDKEAKPIWSIRSDKAKLNEDKMLYLYGNVELKSLTNDAQLERITTDNAQINLVTQDVSSDDEVTIYGTNFSSHGLKMRGNMRDKSARLIDKVKSNYEIQPKTKK